MKTIRLKYSSLEFISKTIYDGFYSPECREVYKNTTLVLLCLLFVQDVSSV